MYIEHIMSITTQQTKDQNIKENKENAQNILNNIVKEIGTKNFIQDLAIAFDVKGGDKPSNRWSLSNRLLMVKQGSMDARTFNDWQKQGRFIKKGSRAIYIFQPITADYCLKCSDKEIQNNYYFTYGIKTVQLWNGVCQQCGISKSKNPDDVLTLFVSAQPSPRYRYEDTTGKPLPIFKPTKKIPLLDIAKKMGIKVTFDEGAKNLNAYGYYNRNDKDIHLATTDETVFFHELIHAIDDRLDKDFNIKSKPKKETIAQLGACVIARMYGIEIIGHTQKYIEMYIGKNKKPDQVGNMCKSVLNEVGKILDYIFKEENKMIKKVKSTKKGVKK